MAYSQIAVILDRSGSMSSVKQDTIGGFNEFVSKQKTNANPTKLLLTQFDDVYEILYNRDVKEVQNLDDTTYVPRGSTALHDAIGRTVSDLGRELSIKNPQDRPDRVLVLIITDGFENASKEYNAAKISEMIKHQQEKYSWEFMFLGTSKEAVLSAQSYGIKSGNTAVYFSGNVNGALRTMSAKASNYASADITDISKATQDLAFTEQEMADLLDDKKPVKK